MLWAYHEGGKQHSLDACNVGSKISSIECIVAANEPIFSASECETAPEGLGEVPADCCAGALAAVGCADGSVHLVDVSAGRIASTIPAHRGRVYSLQWIPAAAVPSRLEDSQLSGEEVEQVHKVGEPAGCPFWWLMSACGDDETVKFFGIHVTPPHTASLAGGQGGGSEPAVPAAGADHCVGLQSSTAAKDLPALQPGSRDIGEAPTTTGGSDAQASAAADALDASPKARADVQASAPLLHVNVNQNGSIKMPKPPAGGSQSPKSRLWLMARALPAAATQADAGRAAALALQRQSPSLPAIGSAFGPTFWVAVSSYSGALLFLHVNPNSQKPLATVKASHLHSRTIFSIDFVSDVDCQLNMVTTSMDRSLLLSAVHLQPEINSRAQTQSSSVQSLGDGSLPEPDRHSFSMESCSAETGAGSRPPACPMPQSQCDDDPGAAGESEGRSAGAASSLDQAVQPRVTGCSARWRLLGLGGYVYCLGTNCTADKLAVGCGDKTIRLLDLHAPETVRKLCHMSTYLQYASCISLPLSN